MSQDKSLGLLAWVGLAGLLAAGCGSSSGSPADAGADIVHKGPGAIVSDGSSGDSGDDGSTAVVADRTSGKVCKTDADCVSDGGPGIDKCSNGASFVFTYTGVKVLPLPTPVCMVPPTFVCDPQPPSDTAGQFLHFCDGNDDPSSPAICIPSTVAHQGACVPVCTFAPDGSAPTSCGGHNVCTPYTFAQDSQTGAIVGYGFCQGTCEQDSDCADLGAGWGCQTDIGLCTQKKNTARRKQIGDACSQSARVNDLTSGACNCQLVNNMTGNGFCTSACIVGGSVPCPNGWTCDNEESSTLPDQSTLAAENVQTAGLCVPACSMGGDAGPGGAADAAPEAAGGGSDASSGGDAAGEGGAVTPEAGAPLTTCPANSTCQAFTPNGSECWP